MHDFNTFILIVIILQISLAFQLKNTPNKHIYLKLSKQDTLGLVRITNI